MENKSLTHVRFIDTPSTQDKMTDCPQHIVTNLPLALLVHPLPWSLPLTWVRFYLFECRLLLSPNRSPLTIVLKSLRSNPSHNRVMIQLNRDMALIHLQRVQTVNPLSRSFKIKTSHSHARPIWEIINPTHQRIHSERRDQRSWDQHEQRQNRFNNYRRWSSHRKRNRWGEGTRGGIIVYENNFCHLIHSRSLNIGPPCSRLFISARVIRNGFKSVIWLLVLPCQLRMIRGWKITPNLHPHSYHSWGFDRLNLSHQCRSRSRNFVIKMEFQRRSDNRRRDMEKFAFLLLLSPHLPHTQLVALVRCWFFVC